MLELNILAKSISYKCKIAPIAIFAYNRPDFFEKTLISLCDCYQISKSDVFIYCDGPKFDASIEEVLKIRKVREIAEKINIGKSKEIIVKTENSGLRNSIVKGVSDILNIYNNVIVLEDDLILARNFLIFMNQALDKYKYEDRIHSVTGFCPPIKIPSLYGYDSFFFFRASSWGWGTWKRVWDKFDKEIIDYDHLKRDKSEIRKFNRGGDDLMLTLKAMLEKKNSSWAIEFCYSHYRNDAYCIYPIHTLVNNIGFGSDATHTKLRPKYAPLSFDKDFLHKVNFVFPETMTVDEQIAKKFQKIVKTALVDKLVSKFRTALRAVVNAFAYCLGHC